MADPPSTPAHEITAQAAPLPPLTLNATDKVDLHLHTLASDGAWTPAALIDHLAANDFRVAAVADHMEVRQVATVSVAEDRKSSARILFDKGRNLAERVLVEQFQI